MPAASTNQSPESNPSNRACCGVFAIIHLRFLAELSGDWFSMIISVLLTNLFDKRTCWLNRRGAPAADVGTRPGLKTVPSVVRPPELRCVSSVRQMGTRPLARDGTHSP